MTEVIVDAEKLAYGLRVGIGETDTIFASGPEELRLRYSPCGLVSSAIYHYCIEQDIPARLMLGNPDWEFDPNMQHVVPWIGEETAVDPTVVDASYSQFLGYVGLTWGYEERTGINAFPTQEVLSFKLSEYDVMAGWLANIAADFQMARTEARDPDGFKLEDRPLSHADHTTILNAYRQLWHPDNYQMWFPPEHVVRHGRETAPHIPDGAIELRTQTQ